MKYCVFCGAALPDEAIFCKSCGKKLEEKVATPPTSKAPENVHPDVTNLNPLSVDQIAQQMKEEDLETLKKEEKIMYWRDLNGNKITLDGEGYIRPFEPNDVRVAIFFSIDFFEIYYNDDPRQSISAEDFTFGDAPTPKKDVIYNLEDGNALEQRSDSDVITIWEGKENVCNFGDLRYFFRYYKLRPKPQKLKKERQPISVEQRKTQEQSHLVNAWEKEALEKEREALEQRERDLATLTRLRERYERTKDKRDWLVMREKEIDVEKQTKIAENYRKLAERQRRRSARATEIEAVARTRQAMSLERIATEMEEALSKYGEYADAEIWNEWPLLDGNIAELCTDEMDEGAPPRVEISSPNDVLVATFYSPEKLKRYYNDGQQKVPGTPTQARQYFNSLLSSGKDVIMLADGNLLQVGEDEEKRGEYFIIIYPLEVFETMSMKEIEIDQCDDPEKKMEVDEELDKMYPHWMICMFPSIEFYFKHYNLVPLPLSEQKKRAVYWDEMIRRIESVRAKGTKKKKGFIKGFLSGFKEGLKGA